MGLFTRDDFVLDCDWRDTYPQITSWSTSTVSSGAYMVRGSITMRCEAPDQPRVFHPAVQISRTAADRIIGGQEADDNGYDLGSSNENEEKNDTIVENLAAVRLALASSMDEAVSIINNSLQEIVNEARDSFNAITVGEDA